MRGRLTTIMSVAAAAMLPGCAGLAGGSLIREGESPATFRIFNGSQHPINVVTFSRCQAMTMGLNRLSASDSIDAGRGAFWTIGAGCWDVEVGWTGDGSQSKRGRYQIDPGQTVTVNYTGRYE